MSDNDFAQWQGRSGNAAVEDPHQRLLGKLSKLLEVKNRAATEAEATTAAALLSRFLTEHNLSIADIEKKGQTAPGITEGAHDLGKAAFKWKLDLAEGIAEFYYCAPLVDRYRKTVKFVGRPDNVEALTMLYSWVIEQVKDIAREGRRAHFDETGEHIDPLRWQVSFGEGAVSRLIVRLREMRTRQQEDASAARNDMGDIVGLQLHHATEASDYLEVKYGYRKDGKRTKAEQEREERYQKRQEEKDSLKVVCEANGDMEPYYEAYPFERPDTPEEIAEREKRDAKWLADWHKKEARNARRRTGSYREAKVDYEKEAQSSRAREAGSAAAGRVNLQPFVGGATDRKKVG